MPSGKHYDYDFDDLLRVYATLGVREGRDIYVTSDLSRLMRYREPGRDALLASHLRALQELLGPTGTLFVPTASLNLCNTGIMFDPDVTPSADMGVFAEYVRTRPNAVRSFHPFWSFAGIGPAAPKFLHDVSRHGYGWGSVFQRFVSNDVLGLNVGLSPHYSISVIHHIETVVGVPYRYNKEFIHPVLRAGREVKEPFYLNVLYRKCDIVRDKNQKIFNHFQRCGTLKDAVLGRGKAYSFSHAEFFRVTAELLKQDIYAWLEQPPTRRPYQH